MERRRVRLAVDEIRPVFRAAGEDIELMRVDDRHHLVLIKLMLPPERCRGPVVAELRMLDEEIRRRDPSIRSVALVQAPRDAV